MTPRPESEGRALARAFSAEVVEPLLAAALPGLRCSTGRLGSGSEVLGLDDAVSQDHDWGPRLDVVVQEGAVPAVTEALDAGLPARFAGRPVRFPTTWAPEPRHHVRVRTAGELAVDLTGVDPTSPLGLIDRLSLTGQAVLELTAGPVFRDDDGVLAALRIAVAPPDDIRRWAVASAWTRIEQELPFVGRAADRGDEAGSRVVAARLAHTAMRLGFLLEGRPAPYAKWLGTAFLALPDAAAAAPLLDAAVAGHGRRDREAALAAALDLLAGLQPRVGLPSLEPVTEPFWDRPYRGLRPIAGLVRDTIRDDEVRGLPLVGPPDLWTDDVRILTDHPLRRRMVAGLLDLPTGDVRDPA